MEFSWRSFRAGLICFSALLLFPISNSAQVTTDPKQDRENDPRLHALTNARIVAAPARPSRKGRAHSRWASSWKWTRCEIPAEARVWDLAGKTIYPGFIDSYSRLGLPETLQPEPLRTESTRTIQRQAKGVPRKRPGNALWIRVSRRNARPPIPQPRQEGTQNSATWFHERGCVPGRGIFRGSSALINLQEATWPQWLSRLWSRSTSHSISIVRYRGYPNSLWSIALIRQSYLDASWYQAAQEGIGRVRPRGAPGDKR